MLRTVGKYIFPFLLTAITMSLWPDQEAIKVMWLTGEEILNQLLWFL